MIVPGKTRWKNWADCLRQEMMTSLSAEMTKSVKSIFSETETTKTETSLQSDRFWRACQGGKSPNDFFVKAGFEIDFLQDDNHTVREVTFRLNSTWMGIL